MQRGAALQWLSDKMLATIIRQTTFWDFSLTNRSRDVLFDDLKLSPSTNAISLGAILAYKLLKFSEQIYRACSRVTNRISFLRKKLWW